MRTLNKKKGSVMVEVLVATSIITAALLFAMAVAQKSIYASRLGFHQSQAALLLEEGAEVVRLIRDADWDNITALAEETDYYFSFSGGAWSLSTSPNTVGSFTRVLNIEGVCRNSMTDDIDPLCGGGSYVDIGIRLVNLSVTWSEGNQSFSKTLSFYIFDIFS